MVIMKRFTILSMLVALLTACTEDHTSDVAPSDGNTIYASIAEMESGSRVQLSDNKHTVWNAGDCIVVYNSEAMYEYRFNGKDGDREGSFSKIGYYLSMSDYEHGFAQNQWSAFYSTDTRFYPGYATVGEQSYLTFATMIPQTVAYLKDSYGLKTNIMHGSSTDGVNFQFKNMMGYLRLSVIGSKCVQSVELSSPDGNIMSGQYVIGIVNTSVCGWTQGTSTNQIIDCGSEGVQLNATPTNFYFALPPQIFDNGIAVTINFTDGSSYQKRTTKRIAIERNAIQPMAMLDTATDPYTQKIYIYHSGDYVSAPMVDGSTGIILWGDGESSLLSKFTSYNYTDGLPSHTITVKTDHANAFTMHDFSGISKIDLSNF